MREEDLPKELSDRIVTTSADVYMRHYDLNPADFDLIGVRSSGSNQEDSAIPGIFEKISKKMKSENLVAITDVRISEAVNHSNVISTVYGTGLVKKAKE